MSDIVVRTSSIFQDRLQDFITRKPALANRFSDFIKFKTQEPLRAFNNTDRPFLGGVGILKSAVPGETLQHVHLAGDALLIYSIRGRDPRELKLYALVSHDDLGVGQPANMKRQRQWADRLANLSGSFAGADPAPKPSRR